MENVYSIVLGGTPIIRGLYVFMYITDRNLVARYSIKKKNFCPFVRLCVVRLCVRVRVFRSVFLFDAVRVRFSPSMFLKDTALMQYE